MIQLIGIVIALTLTLAVVPISAAQLSTVTITQNNTIGPAHTAVTPSASPTPPSASASAPGHGATPPGQGGTPPGQAKPAEPDLDEDDPDPTGLLGAADRSIVITLPPDRLRR
jgi:hypothetical protein